MKILHLTPHLGGGVGTVVRAYLSYEMAHGTDSHSLVALEHLDSLSREHLTDIGCPWFDDVANGNINLAFEIERSDVVLVHWWNHPLLQQLLMNEKLPASRLVFWTHISGQPSPNCFSKFTIEYPDRLIFTTPLSWFTPEIQSLSKVEQEGIDTIWSTAGIDRLQVHPGWENPFTRKSDLASYVGNLDFTKVHDELIDLAVGLANTGAGVKIIGPPTPEFNRRLSRRDLPPGLNYLGYVTENEKLEVLTESKIFAYPLARHHYATCDQSIQEAMALGCVPVVLNNPMESFMVEHGVTGLVASDTESFSRYCQLLLSDNSLREKLAQQGMDFARQEYSLSRLARKWKSVFFEMMQTSARVREPESTSLARRLRPSEVFMTSLGNHAGPFRAWVEAKNHKERMVAEAQISCLTAFPNWTSPTKSSVHHYFRWFPEDATLARWSQLTSISTTNESEQMNSAERSSLGSWLEA
jgi:glycosyltransferase involved in cell wall biosynthesis